MAEETQEGQKTVVSFVVGLLIGGLLVWAFSGPADENAAIKKEARATSSEAVVDTTETSTESEESEESNPTSPNEAPRAALPVGEGKIEVSNKAAGSSVTLASATYPVSEGWVGVRDYQNDRLGGLLGVVRFSESQGLVPSKIVLQRPTVSGTEYAVVVYREDGDFSFDLAKDMQIDTIYSTFTAE